MERNWFVEVRHFDYTRFNMTDKIYYDAVVNMNHVVSIKQLSNDSFKLCMSDGSVFFVEQDQFDHLMEVMSA